MAQITQTIPAGYKQTEIGVIPEDWDVENLGNFVSIRSGESPSKFKISKSGVPYFKVDQLNNSIKLQKETPYYIEVSNPIKANSLIFPKRGAAIYQDKIRILAQDSYMDTNLMTLTVDSKLDYEYLFYYLVNKGLSHIADTTSVPQINNKHIIPFKIIFPKSKPEQTAIATVLSDTDALIEKLEKLIAKKKAVKLGAMQQLLTGKKRLPGFSGEWEVKKLEGLGEIVTGSTPSTKINEYWGGNIPWITPTDINEKKNIYSSEREITLLAFQASRKLPTNTLLVTCIASIGKNAILKKPGVCNQQINAIIPNQDHDVEFLYYLIENNKSYLLSKAGITATLIISKKEFSEIEFKVPKNKNEQTAIATVLSDMDAEIEKLEKSLAKYQQIKTGMMQQLLTGKIRLVKN